MFVKSVHRVPDRKRSRVHINKDGLSKHPLLLFHVQFIKLFFLLFAFQFYFREEISQAFESGVGSRVPLRWRALGYGSGPAPRDTGVPHGAGLGTQQEIPSPASPAAHTHQAPVLLGQHTD